MGDDRRGFIRDHFFNPTFKTASGKVRALRDMAPIPLFSLSNIEDDHLTARRQLRMEVSIRHLWDGVLSCRNEIATGC
jgi:hypothetical protein